MNNLITVIVLILLGLGYIYFGVRDIIKQKRVFNLNKEYKLKIFLYIFGIIYPILMIFLGIIFLLLLLAILV